MITREFISRIPKTDLHVHLDGSLRLGTLIELARQEKVELPSYEEAGLKETVFKAQYGNLQEYLHGFRYTCAVLNSPEHLERVACELAEDNIAEGVRYVEIRFAPQLHIREGLTAEQAVRAVAEGARRAQKRHNQSDAVRSGRDMPFEFGIIVCALRSFNEQMGEYYRHLFSAAARAPKKEVFAAASLEIAREAVALRDEQGLPVVGFDLAGEEAGYPAANHIAAYAYAHRHYLKKTVHAGEAYGPESIFQAITDCHANRIGHGTFLFAIDLIHNPSILNPARYVEQLAEYIASQRIAIEVCLTSNLQTSPKLVSVERHPLLHMLEHGLSVTICTDNRLMSSTSVCRELELVAENFPVTTHQFRNIILAGFKGSFFPSNYTEKRAYVRQAITLYDSLSRELTV